MFVPRLSSDELPLRSRPLRIRLGDIPALFSEGVEPEPHDPARAWWYHIEAKKLRLKMAWPTLLGRLGERSKSVWLGEARSDAPRDAACAASWASAPSAVNRAATLR